MIINNNKYRFVFLFVFIIFMISIFIFKLAQLQIVEGEQYREIAENKMLQRIEQKAPRGIIYSHDGYELATNRIGYSIELTYLNIEEEKRNTLLLKLVEILEKHNEDYDDEFPIVTDEENNLIFTFKLDEYEWKIKNKIPLEYTAEETLKLLRDRYNVKDEISNEVAIEAIENIHLNSNIPIRLEPDIIFTFQYKEEDWKKWHGFSEEEYGLSAQGSFLKLRDKYDININYTDDEARKILVFREKLKRQGYRSWQPVEIAKDVKHDTVYEIDTIIHELPGVVVSAKPVREYPNKELVAHVLGYIGRVNKTDVEEKGYKLTDMKGISGIEYSFEQYLKGVDGERLLITDYKGRPQYDLLNETIPAQPGNNVILTLDLKLQEATEKALKEHLAYLNKSKKAKNAKSGAVVVTDVNTGAVLALASYPTYDPNLFSLGISNEDWKKLNILIDDPLYPKPLYNNATLTALQPGSTFKPLMALAGLEEGAINPRDTIYCRGYHPIFTQFHCWARSGHGSENVVEAIKDSCNVYFYEVGYRVGIDVIEKYAQMFGLGEKTGLEISETSGFLATKYDKKRIWTFVTSDYIRDQVGIRGTQIIINDEGNEQEVYKSYAIAKELHTEITQEKFPSYGDVYYETARMLSKYNIKETKYLHKITQYVLAGRWVTSDTVNASIGQGGNSFTPIQLANYIGTLVNGGNHYQTYLVDKVVSPEGEVVYQHEKNLINKINVNPKNIELVKQGMKQVAMYSSGRRAFSGFDHKNIGVGGKTGTAQYGSEDVENTAWFVCFTPYAKPEIAVAVMIIQGESSANAVPVARKVVDAYYENKGTYTQEDNKTFDIQLLP